MKIRALPAEKGSVRRYVEELWLPYHRELEATVDTHALAEDVDLITEEVTFRIGRLEEESYRTWVAIDGGRDQSSDSDSSLVDVDGTLAGFVTADINEPFPGL